MRYCRLVVVLTLCVCVTHAASLVAGEFRAGIATVEITPPTGYRMSGYFSERFNTGTNDPLLAKAVVFEQGSRAASLVFCDIIGISLDVSDRARKQASQATGIPVSHIAIAATHSHTGPSYFGALREHFHRKAVVKYGSDPHERIDYSAELVGKLVAVIKQARKAAQPIRLSAGYARENRLSFNRRFHMNNGTVRFNPGQLNPNITHPAGPIDSEVGIVRLTSSDGSRLLGALVSFALHLDTVGGTKYSADYPRFLQDSLRKSQGPEFVSLFGTGTCGDINHVDVKTRGRRSTKKIGTMLAQTVEDQLPKLQPVKDTSLAVRSAKVNARLQTYADEEVAEALRKMEHVASRQVPFLERVEAYKISALQLRKGNTIPVEVQAFRLSGDVAVVTLPGEVFVELGMAIKEESPFETTLVIELTNDAPGYIPTNKAFAEGSYETVNSRVTPGSGEEMVKTAARLLKELKVSTD